MKSRGGGQGTPKDKEDPTQPQRIGNPKKKKKGVGGGGDQRQEAEKRAVEGETGRVRERGGVDS